MKQNDVIEYLDNLKKGSFCTINIPITKYKEIPVTVMYMGKDARDRYNFRDTGKFVMTKDFIEQQEIEVDEIYDKEQAMQIYSKLKLEQNKKIKKQNKVR